VLRGFGAGLNIAETSFLRLGYRLLTMLRLGFHGL